MLLGQGRFGISAGARLNRAFFFRGLWFVFAASFCLPLELSMGFGGGAARSRIPIFLAGRPAIRLLFDCHDYPPEIACCRD